MTRDEFINSAKKFKVKKRNLLVALSEGRAILDACKLADTSEFSYYNWLKQDPAFKEAAQQAKDVSLEYFEGILNSAAHKAYDNPKYFPFLNLILKSRGRNVYGDVSTVINKNPEPIKLILEDDMAPEKPDDVNKS